MDNRVFISSSKIIAPGVSENECITNSLFNGRLEIPMDSEGTHLDKKAKFTTFTTPRQNTYSPNKSSKNIIRKDILGLGICIQALCKELNLKEKEMATLPIHLAITGSVKHLKKIVPHISNLTKPSFPSRKIQNIFKPLPPILSLLGLRNGAQSFSTPYCEAIAGFLALTEAFESIRSGKSDQAIVGTCNLSKPEPLSDNSNVEPKHSKESSTAVCILLESSRSLKKRRAKALAEIKNPRQIMKATYPIKAKSNFDIDILKNTKKSIIYGGAFTQAGFDYDAKIVKGHDPNAFSFFPYWGNTGTSSLLLSIALAYEKLSLETGSYRCIDYDSVARNFSVDINSFN